MKNSQGIIIIIIINEVGKVSTKGRELPSQESSQIPGEKGSYKYLGLLEWDTRNQR